MGRRKIVLEDIIDLISQAKIFHEHRVMQGVHDKEDDCMRLVLQGIALGDFKGASAVVAAKLALSLEKECPGDRWAA